MKVDLVTIFPKVVLETEKEEKGKLVRDYGAMDEFVYLNAHITSYNRLLSRRSDFKSQVMKCIDQTHRAIVDSARKFLDDYIVVVDENVSWEGPEPPNPASVHLLTYFLNLNGVDARLGLDFGKAVLLPDGQEDRYINNCDTPWDENSPWVLPIEQSSQVGVRLNTQVEGVVERALCTVHETRIETYEKIMTAIALFNQSRRLSLFYPNSSVVLIVSALEALFNIPDIPRKKEVFAYTVQVHWGFDKNVNKWARELYELRNAVVHGGVVGEKKWKPSPDRYYSHYEIARKVFDDCLRIVLELHGAMSVSSDDKSTKRKRLIGLVVSNEKKIKNIIALSNRIIPHNRDTTEKASLYREFFDTIETLDLEDDSARGFVIPFLDAVFSLVLDRVGFEREWMESLFTTNTRLHMEARMPYYDRIAGIIGRIRTIGSWSGSKLSQAGELRLNSHIVALLQVTTELKVLPAPSIMICGMTTIEEFLSKCLRAINNVSGSGK